MKLKKKNIKAIVIGSVIILSNIAVFSYMQYRLSNTNKTYQSEMYIVEQSQNELKKTLLVPSRDIQKGEELDIKDFTTMSIETSVESEYYLSKEDFEDSKYAVVELKAMHPVYSSMILDFEISDSDRVEEFNMFLLQSDLKSNDFVDVRIFFPNGENYIVLDKKKVMNLNLENNIVWLNLDEKEINYISSAIIDSYIVGAKIYVNRYVEPSIQENSEPTYLPNIEVLNLISSSPNVLFEIKSNTNFEQSRIKRELLDFRLDALIEEKLQSVETGVQNEKALNEEVITKNIEKEKNEQPKEEEIYINDGEVGEANEEVNGIWK